MEPQNQYIVFSLEEKYYAISLSKVVEVIRAVELILLPDAPDILLGLINVKGKMIPVINIRKQFHLPDRRIELQDRIIIFQTSTRAIAFIVDKIEDVVEFSQVDKAQQIFSDMVSFFKGIGKFKDDTALICNVDNLFCLQNTNGFEQVNIKANDNNRS